MTPSSPPLQLEALAEDAWLLRFGNMIDAQVNARVHAAATGIQTQLQGVECVPSYASVLLRFDPAAWRGDDGRFAPERLRAAITAALEAVTTSEATSRLVDIPVRYGGSAGEDLAEVAAHAGLSIDDVVSRHTAVTYRVAMLGFAPGFPYLLGLDPALFMPRRSSPRTRVPRGSIAIGGQQTGIYPQDLPGGWQLIGQTPVRLFDLSAAHPSLLQPGDHVRFRAIDEDEFARLTANAGKPA